MNKSGIQETINNKKFIKRIITYIAIAALMYNLNALVDMFVHPDIPFFDEEHLIVGGITALVTLLLFGILEIYLHHLNNAIAKIKTLENFLSICSHCKKIKIPGADPKKTDSWEQIESYISENTPTKFSHGICPGCGSKHYPDCAQIFNGSKALHSKIDT